MYTYLFHEKINNILKRYKSLLVAGGYKLRLKLEKKIPLFCTKYVKTSLKKIYNKDNSIKTN